MNLSTKQKQTHRHREQPGGCQWGIGGGGGVDCKFGVSRCKLVYIGWIKNKVLLCSTGSYIQYPVIYHNKKKYAKRNTYTFICITESLCCIAEINTQL